MIRKFKVLLAWSITIITILNLVCEFLWGYHPMFFMLFFYIQIPTMIMFFLGIFTYFVVFLAGLYRHQKFEALDAIFGGIVALVFVLQSFKVNNFRLSPSYLGARTALYQAGINDVRQEAYRILDQLNDPKTEGEIFLDETKRELKITPPMKKVYPVYLHLWTNETSHHERAIFIKKFGLGDASGFVISKEFSQLEANRIAEGIYWHEPSHN